MALTLVVEDGTGKSDANSYVSVADCDAYHDKHLYATDWTSASGSTKDKALAMATMAIDANMDYYGWKKTSDQALLWPRVRVNDKEIYDVTVGADLSVSNYYFNENEIPQQLKDATCEMARELIKSDRTQDEEGKGISSLGVGSGAVDVVFDKMDKKQVFTDYIKRLLSPLGQVKGNRSTIKLYR